jgi:hypothetical protein
MARERSSTCREVESRLAGRFLYNQPEEKLKALPADILAEMARTDELEVYCASHSLMI